MDRNLLVIISYSLILVILVQIRKLHCFHYFTPHFRSHTFALTLLVFLDWWGGNLLEEWSEHGGSNFIATHRHQLPHR